MVNQFIIEGAVLPSRYCVKPVIAPGPMHDKILAVLRRYFSAYEIPELEEGCGVGPMIAGSCSVTLLM